MVYEKGGTRTSHGAYLYEHVLTPRAGGTEGRAVTQQRNHGSKLLLGTGELQLAQPQHSLTAASRGRGGARQQIYEKVRNKSRKSLRKGVACSCTIFGATTKRRNLRNAEIRLYYFTKYYHVQIAFRISCLGCVLVLVRHNLVVSNVI